MKPERIILNDPWLWWERLDYEAPYSAAFHRHPAWQLTASLYGIFRFSTRGRTHFVHPGEWILFPPEMLHTAGSRSRKSGAVQIFFRRFPADQMPEPAAKFNAARNFVLKGKIPQGSLERITSEFLLLSEEKSLMGNSWKNLLPSDFVLNALRSADLGGIPPSGGNPHMPQVLEFMEDHFAEPLGVADFAKVMDLSESRFNDVFRESTGESPMKYFNRIRLSKAQMFLLEENSVETAAQKAGFASASYFCRYFKKCLGMTPGKFRENPYPDGVG